MALYTRMWERNEDNPRRGRENKALLRMAGYQRVAGFAAAAEVRGTVEVARAFADLVEQSFRRPTFADPVTQLGWADQQRLDQMVAAVHQWAENLDAFSTTLLCQSIGWVPEEGHE